MSSSSETDYLYRFRARQDKEDGQCDITARGIRWWSGSSSVWLPWSVIAKHEVSPKSHPKAMLRLSRSGADEKAVILTILEANRERAYANLMQAKETINVVVKRRKKHDNQKKRALETKKKNGTGDDDDDDDHHGEEKADAPGGSTKVQKKTTSGATDEARRRRSELSADATLDALHRDLVGGGVVDEETFWASRGGAPRKSLRVSSPAVSNALLVDEPAKRNANKVTYTLNAEKKDYVFRMYPAVKRAHEALVVGSGKMTEAQFWTKYFQSKYFKRDKGEAVLEAKRKKEDDSGVEDDLFARYDLDDEGLGQNETKTTTRHVARAVDVAKTSFDRDLVEGNDEEPPDEEPKGVVAPRASLIVAKFNRHADLVVKATVDDRDAAADVQEKNDSSLVDEDAASLLPPKPTFQPLFVDDFRNPDFRRTTEAKPPRPKQQHLQTQQKASSSCMAWRAEDVAPRTPLDEAPSASRAAFAFLDRKCQRAGDDDKPEEPFRSLAEEKATFTLETLKLLYRAYDSNKEPTTVQNLKARLASLQRDLDTLRNELRDQRPKGATHAAILKPLRDQIDLALQLGVAV